MRAVRLFEDRGLGVVDRLTRILDLTLTRREAGPLRA
jgi:hypothetical protein